MSSGTTACNDVMINIFVDVIMVGVRTPKVPEIVTNSGDSVVL